MVRAIIQFVGYANSGKTTYIQEAISRAIHKDISIATIKHHGHNKQLSFSTSKDTDKHYAAGASVATVTTENEIHIHSKKQIELDILINMYQLLHVQCILIEGYKQKSYPKVVFIHKIEDLHLLTTLSNIIAVVTDFPVNQMYPIFSYQDKENFFRWFFKQ